jgi:hypothetical protein
MPAEDTSASTLESAARRLERSLAALERRLEPLLRSAVPPDMFGDDRARLAEELDRERARSRELEAAAEEASAALGRATAELRDIMARES